MVGLEHSRVLKSTAKIVGGTLSLKSTGVSGMPDVECS